MELFVSAGEASSDIHCGHLIGELKKKLGAEGLTTFGLGGDACAAQATELLMHNRDFSVGGGPLEVIAKLPMRRSLERLVERRLFARRPDGAILVDNGEINLRLASLLHFFGVPTVYFIPPKIWVWRHSRIEDMAHHVNLVLSILPFEAPMYKEWSVPFQYVGNPLVDEISERLTDAEARKNLGIDANVPVVTVLAGSRHNEVRYQSKLFAEGIGKFLEKLPVAERRPLVLLPAAQAIDPAILEREFQGLNAKVVKGMSHECLRVARAALVKSGTSTLEAALLGTPMVLAYHSSKSAEWVYKHVVGYKGFVGLVNLFHAKSPEAALGWDAPEKPLVPELILSRCTPENIASELHKIYREGPERQAMLTRLGTTRRLLMPPAELGGSPLSAAAEAALALFRKCAAGQVS